MAYGGVAVGPPAAAGQPAIRQVKLDKECELRIEVGPDTPLRLGLLTGTAEIFGTEMAPGIWLTFSPRCKFAEKLCSMLKDVLKSKPNVDVVKPQKSGGAVSRNKKIRLKDRSYRIKEYFYGLANDLSPDSIIANFSDLSVYKIGGGPQAPRLALPLGVEHAVDPTRLVPVNISQDLHHFVLAVSYAKEPDQILSSNVAGFICITDIDIPRKRITYLSPCAGELPSRFLIMGNLAWHEP